MGRFRISKGKAIDLQEWALKQSGAKKFLDSLPKFPKADKTKPGLYVDYEIDENELDDALDWSDVAIATIYAILENNEEKIYLGDIRAYNFETYWLSTIEDEEVDNAKNWFELIREEYEKLIKSKKSEKILKGSMPIKSTQKDKYTRLTKEEAEALYKIIKEYKKDAPEGDKEYYDDYYNEYEIPINKKIITSITKKISTFLPEKQKVEIDKDFLRKKYHTFNNEIDDRVYSVIEKAFSHLKSVEIKYFNMESADFSKRKIDIYYKSRRYTIGYCHLKKGIRKFRTSRISYAKLTNGTYQIPKDFDKNKY